MSTTLDLTNIERAKLSNTGEDSDLSRLKAAGPRALPDNPTANKWSAAAIKRQLYMQPEILFGWLKRAIDAFAEFSEATAGLLSSGVVSGAEKDGNGNVITTTYAFDWNVVHFEGDERIYGTKEFVGTIKAASLLPYAGSSAIGDSEDGRWQIGYFKYVDLGYIKSGNLIFTLPNAGGVLVTEAGAQSIADGAKAQAVASAKTYTDGVKNSLQSEIDAINATQNVVDIVGTKANLTAYDTTELHEDDKIEVLADESQNGANTIYSWNGSAWTLIGSKAPYYSIAQITSILTDYVTNVSLANTLENYVTGTALSDALSNALSAYSTTAVCESTYAKIGDSYTKAESDAKYALDTDLSEANAKINALETKTAKQESDIQYLYRQVIGGGDLITETDSGVALTSQPFPLTVSPKALLDYVGGMCQKVNQLVVNGNFADTSGWQRINATTSAQNNKLTISVIASSTITQVYRYVPVTANRTYLVSAYMTASVNVQSAILRLGRADDSPRANLTANTKTRIVGIKTVSSSDIDGQGRAEFNFFFASSSGLSANDTVIVENATCTDITDIYPTDTPASTSDARIQWLMSYLASHPEYDAGSIITAPVTKVVSKGFNLWDEEWEQGYINNDGTIGVNDPAIHSKNYTSVIPNATMYCYCGSSGVGVKHIFYDRDKNFISLVWRANGTFSVPENARYYKVTTDLQYGNTYKGDICINISSSLNGTYMPYRAPIEYPIPAEVRALEGYGWGFNADCNNYASYERKKQVKMIARVDLGSLNYTATPSGSFQSTTYLNDAKKPADNNTKANMRCPNYDVVASNRSYASINDKSIGLSTTGLVTICDTAYSDATAFKQAMQGKYLYYEIAVQVETDVSEYIDSDVIEVSAGGHLEFENENDMGVPYSATYQCEANP